jgi:chemotaxis signal transduction protein
LADRVLDIVSFETAKIQAVPQLARSSRIELLAGLVTLENAMMALIDLPNLLAMQPAGDMPLAKAS